MDPGAFGSAGKPDFADLVGRKAERGTVAGGGRDGGDGLGGEIEELIRAVVDEAVVG